MFELCNSLLTTAILVAIVILTYCHNVFHPVDNIIRHIYIAIAI